MATLDELLTRQTEVKSEIEEIYKEHKDADSMPADVREKWNTLNEEHDSNASLIKDKQAMKDRVAALAGDSRSSEPGFNISPEKPQGEDIYDLSTIRASVSNPEAAVGEMRDRAKRAIESSHFPSRSVSREEAQENVERLLESIDTEDGVLAQRILTTGSPTYKRAFGKAVVGKPLTNDESRALSTTDSAGGYAIPFTLDPSVIHTSNHSVNPFRAVSRVVQVTGDNWNGITSAGVTAAYAAEAAEAGDDSPTLAQPAIAVEKAHAFIPFSIEIGQDWGGLQGEMTSMIQEAKDDLEATKFAFGAGSGSDEPQGLLVGGTVTYTTAGSAALAAADIYGVEGALPPRHRPGASWVANRVQYNRVRQFDNDGGAQLWTENLRAGLANQVPTPGNTGYNLLGYPAFELSTMGTTVTAGHTVAVFGDFSRYVIVDRVGMSVELIPHLFHTSNNRPSGQRGLYAFWRNSAEVVDANAFRKIITAAS